MILIKFNSDYITCLKPSNGLSSRSEKKPRHCNIKPGSQTPSPVPGLHCFSDLVPNTPCSLTHDVHSPSVTFADLFFLEHIKHTFTYWRDSLPASPVSSNVLVFFSLQKLPCLLTTVFRCYFLSCIHGYHFLTATLHFPFQDYYPMIYILLIF